MSEHVGLRCVGLEKRFGGNAALDGVSVTFRERGIYAVVGPNGAGKTTLLSVLSGFLIPDAGEVFLGGRNITKLSPHKRVHLGISRTFQAVRLVFGLSVLDNVLLALPGQKGEGLWRALLSAGLRQEEAANRKRAYALLDLIGLVDKSSAAAGSLSYGQQKLLSLACCLATGAGIILLDEPIAGVHPQQAERIFSFLASLKDKLVVFVEHDLGAVRRIADEVLVMGGGAVIAQGLPREILSLDSVVDTFVN